MSRLNNIWGGISSDIPSEIQFYGDSGLQCLAYQNSMNYRVKSGKFGRSAKFRQRPCLFHILIIVIKNKLTKQTVNILFPLFANVCPNLPDVRSYPTLPYH